MMSKRAVIATSTGCLDYLDLEEKDLYILRMKIIVNDKTYNDFIDINADQFYQMLLDDKKLVPTSSMPSIGEMLDMFEKLEDAGYEEVILNTISSQLSGTNQIAEMAKKQYEGSLKIYVVDTLNAATSEGFISLEALRLIKENVATEEIVSYLNKLKTSRKQYFMVDNLRLLVANGRLSGASGFLGSMFKIKPILIVNDEGKIVSYEKIRTQKKSLERMVELLLEDLKNVKNFIITFDTSNNVEGFEYVKREIEKVYPGYQYYEAPITPVIGCHTGIGTVGVAYFDLDIK
jgi:DegV family protein with EDD domain